MGKKKHREEQNLNLNTGNSPTLSQENIELSGIVMDTTIEQEDKASLENINAELNEISIQMPVFEELNEDKIVEAINLESDDVSQDQQKELSSDLKTKRSEKAFITVLDCVHLNQVVKENNLKNIVENYSKNASKKYPLVLLLDANQTKEDQKAIQSIVKENPFVKVGTTSKDVIKNVFSLIKSKEALLSLNVFANDRKLNADIIDAFGFAKTNTASVGFYSGGQGIDMDSVSSTQISPSKLLEYSQLKGVNRVRPHVQTSNAKTKSMNNTCRRAGESYNLDPEQKTAERLVSEIQREQPLTGLFENKGFGPTPETYKNLPDQIYLVGNVFSAFAKVVGTITLFKTTDPWAFYVPDVAAGTVKTATSIYSTLGKANAVENRGKQNEMEHMEKMYTALLREGLSNKDALTFALLDTITQSAAMKMNYGEILKKSKIQRNKSLAFSIVPYALLLTSVAYGAATGDIDIKAGTLAEYLKAKKTDNYIASSLSSASRGIVTGTSVYNLYSDVAARKQTRKMGEKATNDLDFFHMDDKVLLYKRLANGELHTLQQVEEDTKKLVHDIQVKMLGASTEKKIKNKEEGLDAPVEKKGVIYIDADALFSEKAGIREEEKHLYVDDNIQWNIKQASKEYDIKIIYEEKNISPHKMTLLTNLLPNPNDKERSNSAPITITALDPSLTQSDIEVTESRAFKMARQIKEDIGDPTVNYSNFIYLGSNQEDINLFKASHAFGEPFLAIRSKKQFREIKQDNTEDMTPSKSPEFRQANYIAKDLGEALNIFDKSNVKRFDYLKKLANKRQGRAGAFSLNFPVNAINLSGIFAPKQALNVIDLDSFGLDLKASDEAFNQIKEVLKKMTESKKKKKTNKGKKENSKNLFLVVVPSQDIAKKYRNDLIMEDRSKNNPLSSKVKFISKDDIYGNSLKSVINEQFPNDPYNQLRLINDSSERTQNFLTIDTTVNITTIGTRNNENAFHTIDSLNDAIKGIENQSEVYDNAFLTNVMSKVGKLGELPRGASALSDTEGIKKEMSDTKKEILVSAPQITDLIFRALTAALNLGTIFEPYVAPAIGTVGSFGATLSAFLNSSFKSSKEKQEIINIAKKFVEKALITSMKNGYSTKDSIMISNRALENFMPELEESLNSGHKIENVYGISSKVFSTVGSLGLLTSTIYRPIQETFLFKEAMNSFGLNGTSYTDLSNHDLPFRRPDNSTSNDVYASDIEGFLKENGQNFIQNVSAGVYLAGAAFVTLGQLFQFAFDRKNSARMNNFTAYMENFIETEKFTALIEQATNLHNESKLKGEINEASEIHTPSRNDEKKKLSSIEEISQENSIVVEPETPKEANKTKIRESNELIGATSKDFYDYSSSSNENDKVDKVEVAVEVNSPLKDSLSKSISHEADAALISSVNSSISSRDNLSELKAPSNERKTTVKSSKKQIEPKKQQAQQLKKR